MNGADSLVAFAGLMALGQFSPGPDMLLLTRTAWREGATNGLRMACGIACGLAVHATIAIGGLAFAFQRSSAFDAALRWLAAGYLLWLAAGLIRSSQRHAANVTGVDEPVGRDATPRRPFLRGLLCNLLNPKAAWFLAAVTAPFLADGTTRAWALALWSVIVLQGFVLWSLWVLLLQHRAFKRAYGRAAPWIDGVFAIALALLALRLLAG